MTECGPTLSRMCPTVDAHHEDKAVPLSWWLCYVLHKFHLWIIAFGQRPKGSGGDLKVRGKFTGIYVEKEGCTDVS